MCRSIRCLFVLLVPVHLAAAQQSAEDALRVIRAAETYDDEAVGYAAVKTPTFEAFEVLRDGANQEELLKLTKDRDPIVRCYAVRALSEKHADVGILGLLGEHLLDTEPVETFRGCERARMAAGDAMIDDVWWQLSAPEQLQLARRMIALESPLFARSRALRSLRFGDQDYKRIRALALAGDRAAGIALARYQRPDDVRLLVAELRSHMDFAGRSPSLYAASLHGHPDLLPVLTALRVEARERLSHDTAQRLQPWFEALAGQKTAAATRVLSDFLADGEVPEPKRRQLRRTALAAVAKHLAPAHDPLLRSLHCEHGVVNGPVLRWLLQQDPDATRAQIRRDVATDLRTLDSKTVGACFEILRSDDEAGGAAALAVALRRADPSHASVLAGLAGTWRHRSFVEPLFVLLGRSENPHCWLAAAEALLAFQDPTLDDRLRKVVASTPHMRRGWGAERLQEMLDR